MTRALTVAFVLTSFAVAGCGADCESLCEDWVDQDCCDENDLQGACIDDADDCELYCAQTEALAEKSGCEDELEAWDDCAADLDSICDDNSTCSCEGDTACQLSCDGGDCDSEVEDYSQCTYDYCSHHPDAYACL